MFCTYRSKKWARPAWKIAPTRLQRLCVFPTMLLSEESLNPHRPLLTGVVLPNFHDMLFPRATLYIAQNDGNIFSWICIFPPPTHLCVGSEKKGHSLKEAGHCLPFFKISFSSWPSAKHSQLLYNARLCNQNLRMMNEDLTCQEYANLNFNLRRVCVPSNYWIFSLWWHFYKCKM